MNWWHYLLLVNIYLLLFYVFYSLMLARETFFQLNRIYLVAAAALSFIIPLIQATWVQNLFITQNVQYRIYSSPVFVYKFNPVKDTSITIGEILLVVYLTGILFLLARFIKQLYTLKKVINQPQPNAPYSFFKKVKLGDDIINRDSIAAHEQVHAHQWHSADVLLIELVMIVNWFNPVVYFYRIAIKRIHEFIADKHAIQTGGNKADYALLLLSKTFNTQVHELVNPFYNHSLIKQRIMMLQKNKSSRVALLKYCLSAPLFILMLILSSATVNNSKTVHFINIKAASVFLTPATIVGNVIKTDHEQVLTPAASSNKGNKIAAASTLKQDTIHIAKDKVFTSVEQQPSFPGGIDEFYRFLGKNIRYPKKAFDSGTQGRVIVSFIVEKDGALSNVHVIRGIGDGCDEESVRVLSMSPNWAPGMQNGKPVRTQYTVPIAFSIEDKPAKHFETGDVADPKNTKKDSSNFAGVKTSDNNTIVLSGHPLYFVDGVEVKEIDKLKPEDIKSVTVLKDKPATDLYGARASFGVILIETKKKADGKLLLKSTKE